MAPSRGDQGDDDAVATTTTAATNAAENQNPLSDRYYHRPSLLSGRNVSSWFMASRTGDRVEMEVEDKAATSDYHIWKQQQPASAAQHQNQPSSRTISAQHHQSDSMSLLLSKEEHRAATIAACFLKDYEDGRPPTFSCPLDSSGGSKSSTISDRQLQIYRFKHSWQWKWGGLTLATILLFFGGNGSNRVWTLVLQMTAVVLLAVDLSMKYMVLIHQDQQYVPTAAQGTQQQQLQSSSPRSTRAERWLMCALAVFLSMFTIHCWIVVWLSWNDHDQHDAMHRHPSTLVLAMFKPLVFFYTSRHARDALEALARIGKKLLRVILIELFLILTFAAVACRLYSNDENFQTLAKSWLSLFALSTTVVNPGIWMPAYSESGWNAVFFVIFIVVGVFYLHSLVLSVVFQVFIKSATEVHRRSISDKEQSLRLSFQALTSSASVEHTEGKSFVYPRIIRETLHVLRPHYNRLKLKVLMDIIVPETSDSEHDEKSLTIGNAHTKYPLSYSQFRNRIRKILTSSVRVTRSHSTLGLAVEVLGSSCAICNLAYVILLTSKFDVAWFIRSEFVLGTILTFAALLEAMLRYNPAKFAYRLEPMSRLNAILDGTGAIGAFVSLLGIILKIAGNEIGMDFLLTGRAIGMIQSMRFSVWFREVLQRSFHVLPLLSGPIFLVLSTIHAFVCIGMLIWSGAIDMEELSMNEKVEPLFYLNNFNSYGRGFVTIFNVLVVNDWHQIANVFLFAERNSDPFIVYFFFVAVVIVAVCIMLNVVVAFFVETFVSQLNLVDVEDEVMAGKRNILIFDTTELHKTDIISTNCSLTGEILQFDVIKREGYDEIMESVAVANQNGQCEAFAKSLRDTLDALAAVSTSSLSIGHLVCCRQSMNQFSTDGFQRLVQEYLRPDEVHTVLVEMLDHLSDYGSATSETSCDNQRLVQQHRHPSRPEETLYLTGTILPNNRSVAVLTAEVKPG